jgi:hypothetical protein
MSATNSFESALMSLLFENANVANVGDATGLRGSSTAGVFHISLHTGNPNETGTQTTNEAAYTSYARIPVARSTAAWTVASGVADNDGAINFPQATGGSESETHFGTGSDLSGTGNLFIWGTLTSPLAVSSGVAPTFSPGSLDFSLD